MGGSVKEIPVVWLQGAACTGCSVSLLNVAAPDIAAVLLREIVPGAHVNLLFQMTIMAGQGEPAMKVLKETKQSKPGGYVLVMEGSVQEGAGGAFCEVGEQDGRDIPLTEHIKELASDAMACIAIGTCAAFGGIPAGAPNPTEACALSDFLKREGIATPVVNVPGCPPHPDWFVGTVAGIALNGLPGPDDLDDLARPKEFYGKLIHETCPRRPDFDAGRFAKKFGEPGCLHELGCKGPYTYADCPTRMWNHGASWCVGSGAPCHGCVEPEFPDRLAPLYRKCTQEQLERFKVAPKKA